MNFGMFFIINPFLFLLISLQHLALSENVKVDSKTDNLASKPQIFITRAGFPIPTALMASLKEKFNVTIWPKKSAITKEELIENVKGKFGIFCYIKNEIDKDVIEAAGDTLKVVSTCSVGYDHLDVAELKSRGIRIGYTPGVLSESVGEQAIAVLLAASRRVVEAYNVILEGNWTASNWSPSWLCGHGLDRSVVGIVGCGRIGLSIARKLKAFNIHRLLYSARSKKPEAEELGGEHTTVDDLVKQSDFIVVAISYTEETKGLISRDRINSMKSNAIVVNIARGGIIDQVALTEALQNKKIAGAGLDVTDPEPISLDDPLLKMPNVVITPHLGSATYKCRSVMAELAAKNMLAVFDNEKMPTELIC